MLAMPIDAVPLVSLGDKAQAEIIEALEDTLKLARAGELKALVMLPVDRQGDLAARKLACEREQSLSAVVVTALRAECQPPSEQPCDP
jgi:hypothetical protein